MEIREFDDLSPAELLRADEFTPEELSELTGVGIDTIRRAVFDGNLAANRADDDIVSIPRDAAVAWLRSRQGA